MSEAEEYARSNAAFFKASDGLVERKRIEAISLFILKQFGVGPIDRLSLAHEAEDRFGMLTPEFVCDAVGSEVFLFALNQDDRPKFDRLAVLMRDPTSLRELWMEYSAVAGDLVYRGICFHPKWLRKYVVLHNYPKSVMVQELNFPVITIPLGDDDSFVFLQRADDLLKVARAHRRQTRYGN